MKCQKCAHPYNSYRRPVIFPCGHTYCCICFPQKTMDSCPRCGEEGKVVMNYALFEQLQKNKNNRIQKYLKVCLFGNADVGKSSLIRRVVDDEFNQELNPTIGIDFRYKDIKVDESVYRFQLWDSAGQQQYRSMVTQQLKGSDIVLLLYDLSKRPQDNCLQYWCNLIENNVGHKNIIIVGNKLDKYIQNSMSKNQIELMQKWKHFLISCKTSENIPQLITYLVWLSASLKVEYKRSVMLSSKVNKSMIDQNRCLC